MMGNCKICNTPSRLEKLPQDKGWDVICPVCGKYRISREAHDDLESRSPVESAILRHAIFKMRQRDPLPYLDNAKIENIRRHLTLPSHKEQADNLIRFIGSELSAEGNYGGKVTKASFDEFRAAIGAVQLEDANFIIRELESNGLVRVAKTENRPDISLSLSVQGWDQFDQLMTKGSNARIAFMAMQFNDAELDHMVENCVQPAVADTGFELRRLDLFPKSGIIDNLMRSEIRGARFLLADLTHGNRGAYWEAGYAEGLGKPVIYLCEKSVFNSKKTDKNPHFDTNHCQTVIWEKGAPDECAKQLKATIRVTLPDEARHSDD